MAGLLFVWAVVTVVLMFSSVPYWARVLVGLVILWGAGRFGFIELPFRRRGVIFDGESHTGLRSREAGTPAGREHDVNQMPRLEQGGVRVAVHSVKVTGTLPKKAAITGLATALPFLHRAVTDNLQNQAIGTGILPVSFRTEPDGLIRMVLTGESRIDGFEASQIKNNFVESAMTRAWQFPAAGGPSLVEAEFSIGAGQP